MMTPQEVNTLVRDYIGTDGGYLNGFSYSIHDKFYADYCGLEIDVKSYRARGLTTLRAFTEILKDSKPKVQAKIIRGVLAMIPPPQGAKDESARKRLTLSEQLRSLAARLEGHGDRRSARRYFTSRNKPQSL